jgi:GNAT superfamily N-acetyltransferase/uncharacterized glyoxalase superfamily protein PhnB
MVFHQGIPILYSSNVLKSIEYYTEILGFENSWNWGEPPTFGGVSKNNVQIFFCKECQGNPGTWLSIFVDNVDELYETIKVKGAKIISAPERMEWNVREMLVEDPDGHKIRFGHYTNISHNAKLATLPSTIKIIERTPTPQEHLGLIAAVGWSSSMTDEMEKKVLASPVFSVVAEDTISGKIIGCAMILGDNVSFYYIKDVMVHPDWQHKRVGSALMKEITNWLDANGAPHALVGLYTGSGTMQFYEKFGFTPAFGMNRKISPNKKS